MSELGLRLSFVDAVVNMPRHVFDRTGEVSMLMCCLAKSSSTQKLSSSSAALKAQAATSHKTPHNYYHPLRDLALLPAAVVLNGFVPCPIWQSLIIF
jgi:hypothetical protein